MGYFHLGLCAHNQNLFQPFGDSEGADDRYVEEVANIFPLSDHSSTR